MLVSISNKELSVLKDNVFETNRYAMLITGRVVYIETWNASEIFFQIKRRMCFAYYHEVLAVYPNKMAAYNMKRVLRRYMIHYNRIIYCRNNKGEVK
jgi:hypothetical protein